MMPEIARIFFLRQMAAMLYCKQLDAAHLFKLRRAQLSVRLSFFTGSQWSFQVYNIEGYAGTNQEKWGFRRRFSGQVKSNYGFQAMEQREIWPFQIYILGKYTLLWIHSIFT